MLEFDEGDEVLLKVKVARANREQAFIGFISMQGPYSIRVPLSELTHIHGERNRAEWAIDKGIAWREKYEALHNEIVALVGDHKYDYTEWDTGQSKCRHPEHAAGYTPICPKAWLRESLPSVFPEEN